MKLELVERLISGDDEAERLFRKETTRKAGQPKKNGNSDKVTHTLDEGEGKGFKPKRGNSRAYTLSRLESERPELYARVLSGELSPNGAAVIAGWRQSHLQLLQMHWKKATDEEREEFKEWIDEYTDEDDQTSQRLRNEKVMMPISSK